jgi:hypothetical protein
LSASSNSEAEKSKCEPSPTQQDTRFSRKRRYPTTTLVDEVKLLIYLRFCGIMVKTIFAYHRLMMCDVTASVVMLAQTAPLQERASCGGGM